MSICRISDGAGRPALPPQIAGYPNVRNYYGSWAEWGNHDDLPIEHPRRKT